MLRSEIEWVEAAAKKIAQAEIQKAIAELKAAVMPLAPSKISDSLVKETEPASKKRPLPKHDNL